MKTTKSTKALVTLLVIIILLALAGNYLRNNNGGTNSAAVSGSIGPVNIFSKIRNWFSSPTIQENTRSAPSCNDVWVALDEEIYTRFHGLTNIRSRTACLDFISHWRDDSCENSCPQGMSVDDCSLCCTNILNQFGNYCHIAFRPGWQDNLSLTPTEAPGSTQ